MDLFDSLMAARLFSPAGDPSLRADHGPGLSDTTLLASLAPER